MTKKPRFSIMFARLACCLLLGGWALPAGAEQRPRVTGVSLSSESGVETLVVSFDRPVFYRKLFRLDGPYRVVMDLPPIDTAMLQLPRNADAKLTRAIRSGAFDAQTTRVVIETSVPLFSVEGKQGGQRIRLQMRAESAAKRGKTVNVANQPVQRPEQEEVQTRDELPLIVIDAGHGGKDPGAAGHQLPQEKNVTLRVARLLAGILKASGRYRTLLTRDEDRFILLGERVRIAQRAGAAMFVSLHADTASVASAHGLSVYTVSETASDAEAQKLADQENSVDLLAGFKVDVEDREAASILLELAQRETKNKASQFAEQLVRAFGKQDIHLLPQPHRFAGFRVLKAPDVPSVLIETGFLSNPADERLLASERYPQQLSRGVLSALDAYFRTQKLLQP